jgi:hypothetical protein
VELHLSGLIGTAGHPDMQKIRIIGFFLKICHFSSIYSMYCSRDFKKAYDSVRREVLYNIPIEFGIPKKLVRLIKYVWLKRVAESG